MVRAIMIHGQRITGPSEDRFFYSKNVIEDLVTWDHLLRIF